MGKTSKTNWAAIGGIVTGLVILVPAVVRNWDSICKAVGSSAMAAHFKEVKVQGSLYFVNNAGDTKKGVACQIIFYDEEALRKIATDINEGHSAADKVVDKKQIDSFVEQQTKVASDLLKLKTDATDAWRDYSADLTSYGSTSPQAARAFNAYNTKAAMYKAFLTGNPDAGKASEAVQQIKAKTSQIEADFRTVVNQKVKDCPRIVAETDPEGGYAVTLPSAGTYGIFALVSKMNGPQREKYFVFTRTTFKSAGEYTFDVNNKAIKETCFTKSTPDLEEFEFHFFEELALVKVMSETYGLKPLWPE